MTIIATMTVRYSHGIVTTGEKEEDIYEDLCSFNGVDRQNLHNIPVVEKRDYILKESRAEIILSLLVC